MTHITTAPTKKAFKHNANDFHCTDPAIMKAAVSGTPTEIFRQGIRRFTVTNKQRSWFAEVTESANGKVIVK